MNSLLLYSGLIFLFEPNIFVKYNILNMFYIGGIVLVFIIILLAYIKKGEKISKLFLILLIYRLSILLPTIIYGGDILKVRIFINNNIDGRPSYRILFKKG